jgi:allantoinase
METPSMLTLPKHNRYDYSVIGERKDYSWPGGKRLAFCCTTNIEVYAYRKGTGWDPAKKGEPQQQRNYSWRDYGNRVGIWRCRDLFDELRLPVGVLINTALYDYCPDVVASFRKGQYAWGAEIIGHGHTNAERQSDMKEADEAALIVSCTARIKQEEGTAPRGWLSPWIAETAVTPDLLKEAGYTYNLNWCHDDMPGKMPTRAGDLWTIPYPQEINDIPAVIGRQCGAEEFAGMIIDCYDEMIEQSKKQPLVMGIALHPYLVGQPHRLRQLRRALKHICDDGRAWWTTPGAIYDHVAAL